MDIFEKFIEAESRTDEEGRNSVAPVMDNSGDLPALDTRGGRYGIKPGTKVNYLVVVGPHLRKGRFGLISNREYVVECRAPQGNGVCGKRCRATYHQLYYRTAYSCGCTPRVKHPPIKLEGKKLGRVEVLRWSDEGWELVCHECGEVLYRKTVYQVRAAGTSCESHRVPVA